MSAIRRKFQGKTDGEIYEKVHQVMEKIAGDMSLDYETDDKKRNGKVAKMGITGHYTVNGGEVVVELKYPMLVPGSLKKKVEEKISQKLDGLFA